MALGAFLFVPAASVASYPLFLTALVVLATGITGLQVSANPYVVVLGKTGNSIEPARFDASVQFVGYYYRTKTPAGF